MKQERKLRAQNPWLYRESGAIEVQRTDSFEGVSYDGRLFDEGEIEEMWAMTARAHYDPSPEKRFERLVRLAERHRSSLEWPVVRRIGQWLSNHRFQEAMDALESVGLGPGTADHEEVRMRLVDAQIAKEQSLANEKERAEQKRLQRVENEKLRHKRIELMIKSGRRAKGIDESVAAQHRHELVFRDKETRRWAAWSDPAGASFSNKRYAQRWARHIEGKTHGERDRRLLSQLLSFDRRRTRRGR